MDSNLVHLVNVSGGKDSDCVYLTALEFGVPFRAVFADTGHEHVSTYEHVAMLSSRTGGPEVEWVKADFTDKFELRRKNIIEKWPKPHKGYPNGISDAVIQRALNVMHPTGDQYLDLCLLRGGFPSMKMKFCTDHLKIQPVYEGIVTPLYNAGHDIWQWLGIRRDESKQRENAKWKEEIVDKKGVEYTLYRPLINYSIDDVVAMHKRHNLPLNPLYLKGASRIGCWPCINARKDEIKLISEISPEAIEKLIEWEDIISQASKQGCATFFFARGRKGEKFDHKKHGIEARVQWSKTVRGGKQFPLFEKEHESDVSKSWERQSCLSAGYCE